MLQPFQAVVLCSPVQKSSVEPLCPPGQLLGSSQSLSEALSAALEPIPAPDSLPVVAHVSSLHIPEALIRARVLSSYYWLVFSTVCFVSLGSNSVFYRKPRLSVTLLSTASLTVLSSIGCGWLFLVWVGLVGGFFLPYFFNGRFMG